MSQNEKECFIIMPITTPEPMIDEYRDGKEHFKHVLEYLFKPAVKKAGYIPKPPQAKGSDVIHANIIKNLETADIVLCDISCLNPNVFFEFGIRTSLNKPICIVKDELTESVPFDTGILHYENYKSSLDPWKLEAEINKISKHLVDSSKSSNGVNTLWEVFGFQSEAESYKVADSPDNKLNYLTMQIDILQKKMDESIMEYKQTKNIGRASHTRPELNRFERITKRTWPQGSRYILTDYGGNGMLIKYYGEIDENYREYIYSKE